MIVTVEYREASVNTIITPTAIALGNFDGIHLGHQRVILPVLAKPELVPTVVSFDPHPQEFFTKTPRLLLTPLPEKIQELEKIGIRQLVVIPFTESLSQLSPQAFIENILRKKLDAQVVSVGFNFRFGHQRRGAVADLAAIWGDRLEITSEQVMLNQMRISSSAIRSALAVGDVELAGSLLGRNYSLVGIVIPGQKLGRTIGFPTANLKVHPQKFLPRDGVYAVRVSSSALATKEMAGVMNIGMRPTIPNLEQSRTIEIHIPNWAGNLYEAELKVDLCRFLRPEQKYNNLSNLKAQIATDCAQALELNSAPKLPCQNHQ